jgi:hypothetical protein
MYAVVQGYAGLTTTSRDLNARDWWRGSRWTPASDEAELYDSREEAQAVADAEGGSVVEWTD